LCDWYLDLVCTDGNWDAVIAEENGSPKAVLPYFKKKKAGIRYITMPPLLKYMGPHFLVEPKNLSISHRWLTSLIEALPEFDIFKQNFNPSLENWLPFHWSDYHTENRFTYCMNISNLDEVYNNINRNIKRNIHKATELLTVDYDLDINTFYNIAQLSYKRQEMEFPLNKLFLKKYDAQMALHKQRVIFSAKDNKGQIHAVSYLIYDHHSAYYLISGDDPELRQSGASILLTWEAIKYTQEVLNLNHFDFLGSMMPNVEAIRRQFGAYQQTYVYVNKYRWPIHRTLDRLKDKYF
jgi:lipid II:glycine glycyltransferase (peptidoglycan interpeptide bridge formation enzyme)